MAEREWQSQVVANSCAEAAEIVRERKFASGAYFRGEWARGANPLAGAFLGVEPPQRLAGVRLGEPGPDLVELVERADKNIRREARAPERDRPAFRFKLDESFGVDPRLGHDVIGHFDEKTNAWSFVKLPVEKV